MFRNQIQAGLALWPFPRFLWCSAHLHPLVLCCLFFGNYRIWPWVIFRMVNVTPAVKGSLRQSLILDINTDLYLLLLIAFSWAPKGLNNLPVLPPPHSCRARVAAGPCSVVFCISCCHSCVHAEAQTTAPNSQLLLEILTRSQRAGRIKSLHQLRSNSKCLWF